MQDTHVFGRHWYDFITNHINNRVVSILDPLGIVQFFVEVYGLYRDLKKMPEPTHENVTWQLCHALIDIRDEFFLHERNKIRAKIERAVFNIIIIKYQYDPYYHKRIDWVLKRLLPLLGKNPDWLYQARWLKSDQWWVE